MQDKPQRHGGTERGLSGIKIGLIIDFHTGVLGHGIN